MTVIKAQIMAVVSIFQNHPKVINLKASIHIEVSKPKDSHSEIFMPGKFLMETI